MIPTNINKYAMSVYRDGIYMNAGIDYNFNLETKEDKEKYGKYGRETVQKYYSIKKMVDDCESAYNKTLKEHKK
mgnify:CR=1 FL=1